MKHNYIGPCSTVRKSTVVLKVEGMLSTWTSPQELDGVDSVTAITDPSWSTVIVSMSVRNVSTNEHWKIKMKQE